MDYDTKMATRAEALRLAIEAAGGGRQPSEIVEMAKAFEAYLSGGDDASHRTAN